MDNLFNSEMEVEVVGIYREDNVGNDTITAISMVEYKFGEVE